MWSCVEVNTICKCPHMEKVTHPLIYKRGDRAFLWSSFLNRPWSAMAVDPNFHVNSHSSENILNSEWPIEKVIRWLEDNGCSTITHMFKGMTIRAYFLDYVRWKTIQDGIV